MQISLKTWNQYKNRLASIDKKAAEEMEAYIQRIGGFEDHAEEVIRYAYALASRYGEAAAAAACQMHEAVAEASGVRIPPAVPAEPPDYKEVARAVRGTVKNSSEKQIPRTVGRLVKRTGADTTLKNAERDGAQFAWIPMGDTCAFCLTLASRGWQHMSKNALRNGHAEHIHANCDCQYAIRFDDNTSIEGYDPDKYREMYDNAEGDTPQEKINAMRRMKYQEDKDRIKAQKKVSDDKFNKKNDPLLEVFGAAEDSHPEEVERVLTRAREFGVEVREDSENMAYAPGLKKGEPGQLHISRKDSIGAWLHEEQHMNDDAKDGFLSFEGMFDIDRRSQMEYNAYKREILLAKEAGRMDIVAQLKQLCREEIESFGGVWDEAKLE